MISTGPAAERSGNQLNSPFCSCSACLLTSCAPAERQPAKPAVTATLISKCRLFIACFSAFRLDSSCMVNSETRRWVK